MQKFSEIRRPDRAEQIRDERLRQHLSKIETPSQHKSRTSADSQDAHLPKSAYPSENRTAKGQQTKSKVIWPMLVIVLILAAFFIGLFSSRQDIFGLNELKNKSDWQAVFLSDGQVYFGKVVSQDKLNVTLQNIYYLQEPGSLQQGQDNLNISGRDISLIKLGTEVHGPLDEMRINQEHVLFIEDLKEDSKVVGAIKEYMRQ